MYVTNIEYSHQSIILIHISSQFSCIYCSGSLCWKYQNCCIVWPYLKPTGLLVWSTRVLRGIIRLCFHLTLVLYEVWSSRVLNQKWLSLNGVIRRSINTGPLLVFLLVDVKLESLPDVLVTWAALLFYTRVFGELGMRVSLAVPDILTHWS